MLNSGHEYTRWTDQCAGGEGQVRMGKCEKLHTLMYSSSDDDDDDY